MMVSTWSRSSSSEPSVISTSSRWAGKPVLASSFMICSASVRSRNWTGEMLTAILRWVGQPRASFSACSITDMVSGPTIPVRSAASMKPSASMKPRVGERQRASVSNPTSSREARSISGWKKGTNSPFSTPLRISSSSFSRSCSSRSSSWSNQAKPFRPAPLAA